MSTEPTYRSDPAAYIEAQSDEAQARKAFTKYIETDNARLTRTLTSDDAVVVQVLLDATPEDLFPVFYAGWRAAKAP